MAHYLSLYDESLYLGAQDFPKPSKLKIFSVERSKVAHKVEREGEPDEFKAMIYVTNKAGEKHPRAFIYPRSIGKLMAMRHGTDTDNWVGKEITLYATKCYSFGEITDCIRIVATDKEHDKIRLWLKKRKANPDSYIKQ